MPNINDLMDRLYQSVDKTTKENILQQLKISPDGSLQIKQSGKFSRKELFEGLRYLLVNQEALTRHIEKNVISAQQSYQEDPFFVQDNDWLMLNFVYDEDYDYHHHHDCHLCSMNTDSNDDCAAFTVTLACVCVSAAIVGFFYCFIKNSWDTSQEPRESALVKMAKIGIYLLSAAIPAGVLMTYLGKKDFASLDDLSSPYNNIANITLKYLMPLMLGSIVGALTSFAGKNVIIQKTPSSALLAELTPIKNFLAVDVTSHDTEKWQFIRLAVVYYIERICKENRVGLPQNLRSPLLSHGRFSNHQQTPATNREHDNAAVPLTKFAIV